MAVPFACILLFLLPLVSCSSCPDTLPCITNITISKPFTTVLGCGGPYLIYCDNSTSKIKFHENGLPYVVENISYYDNVLIIQDPTLSQMMQGSNCSFLFEFADPKPRLDPTQFVQYLRSEYINSNRSDYDFSRDIFAKFYNTSPCHRNSLDYSFGFENRSLDPLLSEDCWSSSTSPNFALKLLFEEDGSDLSLSYVGFSHQLRFLRKCFHCHIDYDTCTNGSVVEGDDICRCGNSCSAVRTEKTSRRTIAIVLGAVGGLLALCLVCFLWYNRGKIGRRSSSSKFLIRSVSSKLESSMKDDAELGGSTSYHTHVFSYAELQEATNGFDESKELGDGGFGTVYKGHLKDGRVVAVKRLYENNYKRVEQFLNEVDILSRLRHQNLVTLYGCTSRHSRELLLVYEFINNGTVADHLHGHRASEKALTWPVRLNIAIETADALGYLHAIEPQIIHRDVKTNNILLDNSFHVKVADFGLSRLFPIDATHVSTLPQGTPGYVDPEYHQCYQLTDKSDVYSFGVVLVELISSKPAVDITRHRHEINLASFAINKIQNREIDKLIDPELGYQLDWEMERMITMVAELAFRCLQGDGDMRPSIKEALVELRGIQSRGEKGVEAADVQISDDARLLKNVLPYSPDSVTVRWDSRSTTPNTSS